MCTETVRGKTDNSFYSSKNVFIRCQKYFNVGDQVEGKSYSRTHVYTYQFEYQSKFHIFILITTLFYRKSTKETRNREKPKSSHKELELRRKRPTKLLERFFYFSYLIFNPIFVVQETIGQTWSWFERIGCCWDYFQ